jgi:predicted ATP-grasp superfamily ATP-dependent carboligase
MEIHMIPELRNPVMVIAFGGWSDAGEASTGLISHLLNTVGSDEKASLIAEIDSEEFYDFQVNRPLILISDSLIRNLTWPGVEIFALPYPQGERDFIVVRGVEPSMKWRAFAAELLDFADDCEVSLVISIGSMLADTPHSRDIPVSGTGAHPEIAARLGVEVSRYEGPTGILAVIQDACVKRGVDAVALWAALPHYANGTPSPKAILALLHGLEDFLDITLPQGDLVNAAFEWEANISTLVADDSDLAEYVVTLEESKDSTVMSEDNGEILAREVERFLRRQLNVEGDSESQS